MMADGVFQASEATIVEKGWLQSGVTQRRGAKLIPILGQPSHLLPVPALYLALFVLWRRDRHVSEQAWRIGREVATCAVKHFGVAVAVIEDARPDADQDDVLPARVLEISEETAASVEDADGPGFN